MPLYPGTDSRDIMTELGLSAERQAELIEKGVIGQAERAR
jgi:hypothetical protein